MSFVPLVYRDQLYTERQSRILTNLPRFSAPLSIVGSCTILYIILKDRKRKLQRVYHRLLLVYSLVDVLCSLNFALSAIVVPSGTPGVWGAHGTVTTCQASGFVMQFSWALGVYATFICLYYVLVLRYNVRERTLARTVEPVVHTFALVTPLILGILMLNQGIYNPTNAIIGWCFINVYPMDCLRRDEIACERGEDYYIWLLLNNTPFFLFFIVVAASSILTYTKVRSLEERGSRWAFTRSRQSRHRVQETKMQAFLYIAAFALTYVFFGIGTLLGPSPPTREHRNFYFPVVALIKVFLPLQGLWNCLIYIRPRYTALVQRRGRDLSMWQILGMIFNSTEDAVRVTAQATTTTSGSRNTITSLLGFWPRHRTNSLGGNFRGNDRGNPEQPRVDNDIGSPDREESTSGSRDICSRSSGRLTVGAAEESKVDYQDDFTPEFDNNGDSLPVAEQQQQEEEEEEEEDGLVVVD